MVQIANSGVIDFYIQYRTVRTDDDKQMDFLEINDAGSSLSLISTLFLE